MADKNDELATLEAEFQEVINELTDDPNLDKFRLEYEKIHNALKKSNASNTRLQQKCRELNAEIVANASKVAHALKLSQDDQAGVAEVEILCHFFHFLCGNFVKFFSLENGDR